MQKRLKTIPVLLSVVFMAIGLISTIAHAETIPAYTVDPYHEYSYENMLQDAGELQDMYPDLVRLKSIGTTVEGRDIALIEFGYGSRKVFLSGATHAREYITTSYLMYMIDRYAYAYSSGGILEEFNITEILNNVTFYIVPMINPDGVNLVQNGIYSVKDYDAVSKIAINSLDSFGYNSWKANINGVDLNRNYPSNWYVDRPVDAPSSSRFKGYSPISEPETKAIMDFLNNNMCWAYLSFHSQGEGIYGWNDANAGYYPQINSMVSRIIGASGFKKLTDTSDTDYGTFGDTVRETFLKPTLTIELCKFVGSYPYPNEDFDQVWMPAKNICLIVAEEVMKMQSQDYMVYQNDRFLHAFGEEAYALAYAKKWANSEVLFVKGTNEEFKSIVPAKISISVNGSNVSFPAYNVDGNNYIKLRDLALMLVGSDKQFEVGYNSIDNSILLTRGMAYTVMGGEFVQSIDMVGRMVMLSKVTVYIDDIETNLKAYHIGGSNYFKLQDLGSALDLGVSYDNTTGIISIDDPGQPS
ncbi:MAG TPA: M14 family zinc carboxypeptidase [Anaerovoracaceae bacterium]|nr:M14 family zinc carboxypeptidase [Anaerovoracaceae bacterium]